MPRPRAPRAARTPRPARDALTPAAIPRAPPPGAARRSAGAAGRRGLRLLLAPFLLGAAALVGLRAFLTVGLAFTDYDALSAPSRRGIDNFAALPDDRLFGIAASNSLLFVALAVPLRTLAALGLALLLFDRRPGTRLYRVAVFLPTVVPDVAYALLWLWAPNPVFGPLNLALGALGLPQPVWLADRDTALPALVLMSLFQIGEGFVLLLAGLQGIPRSYHDAGAVDGAGRLQLFRLVTLPLLAPWLVLLAVRDIALSVQSTSVPAYLMTGGGPYDATLFLPLLVHEEAFDRFRFGEASGMMLVLFAGLGLLLCLVFRTVRGWGYADDV